MALDLANKISLFLREKPEVKFTAREIAIWIFENYSDECRKKQQRSTATLNPLIDDASLIQQLVAEIGSRRPHLEKKFNIKTTEGRPRKYYYGVRSDSDEIEQVEKTKGDNRPTEQDLYPKLADYLRTELGVLSKRIDEKRSSNTRGPNGNKWLYPDLVGLEDLSSEWKTQVRECVQHYFDKKTKLWSFEVKRLINQSNVRESFFQTVSNSSWANLAYLVAGDIQGPNTLKEMRILSSLHGIGVIQLDIENPAESQILIPARERDQVDWDTINRLVDENSDFQQYLKFIKQFCQTGEIRKSDWQWPEAHQ